MIPIGSRVVCSLWTSVRIADLLVRRGPACIAFVLPTRIAAQRNDLRSLYTQLRRLRSSTSRLPWRAPTRQLR